MKRYQIQIKEFQKVIFKNAKIVLVVRGHSTKRPKNVYIYVLMDISLSFLIFEVPAEMFLGSTYQMILANHQNSTTPTRQDAKHFL